MRSLTSYCTEKFGGKAYKLSLDGAMSCPNRDGTLDTRGCIFCSAGGTGGIKLQLLHVLEGTDLADDYRAGRFHTLEQDEYVDLVADCLELLKPETVVHRLTGDGPKKTLISPLWSGDKKRLINALREEINRRGLK